MIFYLMNLLLAACSEEAPVEAPTPISPTPLPATAAGPPPATAVPTLAPAGTRPATAVPAPTATPTATLLRVGVAPNVPTELAAAFQSLAEEEDAFVWESPPAPVELAVGGEVLLADWVYAVAAPFATFQDEVSLADLQAAWQAGTLLLDAETMAVLATWWGTPDTEPTVVPAEALVDQLWARQSSYDLPRLTILPFHRLEPRLKVLRVDGAAPIDMDFDPAAYPLTIPMGINGVGATAVAPAWNGPESNWNDGRLTHVVMTGPAGMRRAVADRMDKYGIQYPGEETGPVLQAADIAHMSNENAFAPDCPPADPFDSDNVCNRDEYFALMTWMGIDVNEMTGNHLNDWGAAALHHTFDLYAQNGIQWFGGGRDLAAAAEPLRLEHHGNRIAFVGCNPVGPELGWATADRPGSWPCGDYSQIQAQIWQLADEGYLVIATVQYLEDYQYQVLDEQRQVFQGLAAAGATAVSGSHAHHPQGFAFHEGAFIHYGLGNLLADQMWSLGSRQTFLDIYTFYDGRLLNVDLWTGLNEDYARIRRMTAAERQALLEVVFDASDW